MATVGLTEGLYAVTDGQHVMYFSSYDATESVGAPNIWPIPVDVSMGVAAVTFNEDSPERDGLANPSTTMLGCRCTDNGGLGPLRLQCGMALYELATYGESVTLSEDLVFDVVFNKRSTANFLTCKQVLDTNMLLFGYARY